jgi:methyl-accepting chemotaxis protein
MADILMASQEQTAGIEQINHAVTQMDDVTQQNAALVEEAAAAAQAMQEQVNSLNEVVSTFRLAGGMARATQATVTPIVRAAKAKPQLAAPARTQVSRIAQRPAKPGAVSSSASAEWEQF